MSGVRYPFVTDLAEEWHVACQLPFVFARWVVRRDAPQAVREALLRWLREFRARETELVAEIIPDEAVRLGLSQEVVAEYHRGIQRVLGPDQLAGQERFLEQWHRHGPALLARRTDWVTA